MNVWSNRDLVRIFFTGHAMKRCLKIKSDGNESIAPPDGNEKTTMRESLLSFT